MADASPPLAPKPPGPAKIAAVASAPFVLLEIALALHAAGLVGPDPPIERKILLAVDLVIYWAAASGSIWIVIHRISVLRYLRARLPQIGLMAVSLVVGLAALEVVGRVALPGFAAPSYRSFASPTFHHFYAPNDRMISRETAAYFDGVPMVVETNEDGLRTKYSRDEFLGHATRIAVLGDSYTFGVGVQGDQTSSAVLEQTLRYRLRREDVAALNAGVVSYSPLLESILFRKLVSQYKPHVTVMLLDTTDIGDDYNYSLDIATAEGDDIVFDVGGREPRTSLCDAIGVCLLARSGGLKLAEPIVVLSDLVSRRRDPREYYDFTLAIGGVVETNRYFILRHPPSETKPYFDATRKHIEATARFAAEAGSKFILFIQPRYFHWSQTECPGNWEAPEYKNDEPYASAYLDYFDSLVEEVDFPIVSLLGAVRKAAASKLVFERDPHWNVLGHRVVGRAIADYLIENGYVSAGPSPVGPSPAGLVPEPIS